MHLSDDVHAFLWLDPRANNCNSYLINAEKKILVDPGHHALFDHVRDGLAQLSLSPQDIDLVLITHGHPDHLEGVKVFEGTPTLIAIHKTELDFMKSVGPHYVDSLNLAEFEPDILLQDGDLKVGQLSFRVIHAPGHSPGSFCLYWPDKNALFTGDVIFNQGLGRTDLPGGNGQHLKDSIKKLSRLEVDYLLPGHGDILSGRGRIEANFQDIERMWFGYL